MFSSRGSVVHGGVHVAGEVDDRVGEVVLLAALQGPLRLHVEAVASVERLRLHEELDVACLGLGVVELQGLGEAAVAQEVAEELGLGGLRLAEVRASLGTRKTTG